jgi:hypothetical protein
MYISLSGIKNVSTKKVDSLSESTGVIKQQHGRGA